jgi:hypothetical protein
MDEQGLHEVNNTRLDTGAVYRIVVRGGLSRRYTAASEEMEMEARSRQTSLTVEVSDQARLQSGPPPRHPQTHSRSLGLPLSSVHLLSEDDDQDSSQFGD